MCYNLRSSPFLLASVISFRRKQPVNLHSYKISLILVILTRWRTLKTSLLWAILFLSGINLLLISLSFIRLFLLGLFSFYECYSVLWLVNRWWVILLLIFILLLAKSLSFNFFLRVDEGVVILNLDRWRRNWFIIVWYSLDPHLLLISIFLY